MGLVTRLIHSLTMIVRAVLDFIFKNADTVLPVSTIPKIAPKDICMAADSGAMGISDIIRMAARDNADSTSYVLPVISARIPTRNMITAL